MIKASGVFRWLVVMSEYTGEQLGRGGGMHSTAAVCVVCRKQTFYLQVICLVVCGNG